MVCLLAWYETKCRCRCISAGSTKYMSSCWSMLKRHRAKSEGDLCRFCDRRNGRRASQANCRRATVQSVIAIARAWNPDQNPFPRPECCDALHLFIDVLLSVSTEAWAAACATITATQFLSTLCVGLSCVAARRSTRDLQAH